MPTERITVTVDIEVGFSHGEQVTRANIGPVGPLTLVTSPGTLTDGTVIEDREITGAVSIAAGAHVTLRNCRIIGTTTAGAAGYTVKATNSGGLAVHLEDCEVITRSVATRCVAMFGDGNVTASRCVFRGGVDNAFFSPNNSPGTILTGDPDVPAARVLLEDCWFGDVQREPGSHSDCVQIDGGGYTVIRRCRIMGYSIPEGSDPLTTNADGSEYSSGGLILTQNENAPKQISHVKLADSWAEGANYSVYADPPDGLPVHHVYVHENRFGTGHRFGPLIAPGGSRVGNVWGQTGLTECCGSVTAGQALTGG